MEMPQLTYELYSSDLPTAMFVREAMRRALPFIQFFKWASKNTTLTAVCRYEHLVLQKAANSEEALLQIGDCLVVVEVSGGFVSGHAAGSQAKVEAVIDTLTALFPEPEPRGEIEVPITFWRAGARGPVSSQRTLSVSAWADVIDNYPRVTRRRLDPLLTDFRPGESGRLILWHGDPGTGKSHALRALAWEWAKWCRFEYVIDPEKFLDDSDYLMKVLLQDHEDIDLEDVQPSRDQRWRLLALEDAGELMAADARERVGQQLSRLLNSVDGLLGQGLRLMILITTNEPIGRLHPAISRPGRCAAQIEFARFSAPEARRWAAAHGVSNPIDGDKSLAELYEMLEGGAPNPVPREVNSGLYL